MSTNKGINDKNIEYDEDEIKKGMCGYCFRANVGDDC